MLKDTSEIFGFDDRKVVIIGIPLIALIISAIIFGDILTEKPNTFFQKCFIIGILYTLTFWLAYREMYVYFIKKYKNESTNSKRYLALIPSSIILYIVVKIPVGFLLENYIFNLHDMMHQMEIKPHHITETLTSSIIIILVSLLYESSYLNTQLHKSIVENQELEKQNIQSQLEGLRNKVNPHFLFNSLNTLCTIIPESAERSEHFVRQLSKVYRYILEIRNKKLISLKEELAYLDSYTYLLTERFGDNLNIEIDIPREHFKMNMVPLSLQILLENAIKHNIISKEKPLFVKVYIDDNGKLVVKNNLQKKRHVASSTKFGLENIKERYKFFTEMTVEVISTTQNFIVLLPLIKTNSLN